MPLMLNIWTHQPGKVNSELGASHLMSAQWPQESMVGSVKKIAVVVTVGSSVGTASLSFISRGLDTAKLDLDWDFSNKNKKSPVFRLRYFNVSFTACGPPDSWGNGGKIKRY